MKPRGNGKKTKAHKKTKQKKKSTFSTLRDKRYSHERIDAVKKKVSVALN